MRIAAITYGPGQAERIDAMLCQLARRLSAEGYRLAGAIQWNASDTGGPMCQMDFEDLATGRRIIGSLPGGKAVSGCRLDAPALEDAAGLAAAALDEGVDLVIVNRYGKQEAAGRGFRPVIASAVTHDVPVLLALNSAHLQSFERFTESSAVELPASQDAIDGWCREILRGVHCGRVVSNASGGERTPTTSGS